MSGINQVKRTFSKAVRISSFAEALEKLIYLSAIGLGLGFIIFVLVMMVAFMGVKLFLAFTSAFVLLAVVKGAFVLFLK